MSEHLLPEKSNGGKHQERKTVPADVDWFGLHFILRKTPFWNIYLDTPYGRLSLFLGGKYETTIFREVILFT